MNFQTEFEFELPKGYVDKNGEIHKHGVMRLATAADEIFPLSDKRVKINPGYMSIILLSRVVTKLGNLSSINTNIIESLYTPDIAYLEKLYQTINAVDPVKSRIVCPKCNEEVIVEIPFLGE